jgi:hypothetical protein
MQEGAITAAYILSGSGMSSTPQLGQGIVSPAYDMVGLGMSVTPVIGLGVVTSGTIVPEDLVGLIITGSSSIAEIIGQSPPYFMSIIGDP